MKAVCLCACKFLFFRCAAESLDYSVCKVHVNCISRKTNSMFWDNLDFIVDAIKIWGFQLQLSTEKCSKTKSHIKFHHTIWQRVLRIETANFIVWQVPLLRCKTNRYGALFVTILHSHKLHSAFFSLSKMQFSSIFIRYQKE